VALRLQACAIQRELMRLLQRQVPKAQLQVKRPPLMQASSHGLTKERCGSKILQAGRGKKQLQRP
jgi:hypothetical protein